MYLQEGTEVTEEELIHGPGSASVSSVTSCENDVHWFTGERGERRERTISTEPRSAPAATTSIRYSGRFTLLRSTRSAHFDSLRALCGLLWGNPRDWSQEGKKNGTPVAGTHLRPRRGQDLQRRLDVSPLLVGRTRGVQRQCCLIFARTKRALSASWSIPSTPSSRLIQPSKPTPRSAEKIAS